MYTIIEDIFVQVVNYAILVSELAGVTILIYTLVKAFIGWTRRKRGIRLYLAQGIALALEFKLGGEVLRTVIVREWDELIILGAIILLRAALTFLIHWEIKKEKDADINDLKDGEAPEEIEVPKENE